MRSWSARRCPHLVQYWLSDSGAKRSPRDPAGSVIIADPNLGLERDEWTNAGGVCTSRDAQASGISRVDNQRYSPRGLLAMDMHRPFGRSPTRWTYVARRPKP
jgi:hypothetical protein